MSLPIDRSGNVNADEFWKAVVKKQIGFRVNEGLLGRTVKDAWPRHNFTMQRDVAAAETMLPSLDRSSGHTPRRPTTHHGRDVSDTTTYGQATGHTVTVGKMLLVAPPSPRPRAAVESATPWTPRPREMRAPEDFSRSANFARTSPRLDSGSSAGFNHSAAQGWSPGKAGAMSITGAVAAPSIWDDHLWGRYNR
eukprot:gb/GFBE01016473.1/.p1 GENE.gb/GFBE01016473.1/~~gb/GFBE01016473.1/.p1  ORF type:complete len:194 (+),score=31.28 gb/GFBE01016473.1/:1-582(+)